MPLFHKKVGLEFRSENISEMAKYIEEKTSSLAEALIIIRAMLTYMLLLIYYTHTSDTDISDRQGRACVVHEVGLQIGANLVFHNEFIVFERHPRRQTTH